MRTLGLHSLKWVASHSSNNGPGAWLNHHADFGRIFLDGDSAGANIVHNLAMRAGNQEAGLGLSLTGAVLVQPCFWGSDPIGSELVHREEKEIVNKRVMDRLWSLACPSNQDNDDPRINPMAEGAPSLARLGCRRVLVFVGEKDILRDRGWLYYKALDRSGWTGRVDIEEFEGEGHGFHVLNFGSEKARHLIKQLADFFNMSP
ncbi:Alpha/beta hydrolase-3 [Quillaja saponaria]|uniref:Alpha/beta hydrolase-3 n=1 Tax=Quillaja saponaria TaxID=32244 RepID=A0AAD7PWW5_QUISA|nr:Alpha/beta hydrolase-3 [Quillaja saponaria]